MAEKLRVGQLKEALEGVPDALEITVELVDESHRAVVSVGYERIRRYDKDGTEPWYEGFTIYVGP